MKLEEAKVQFIRSKEGVPVAVIKPSIWKRLIGGEIFVWLDDFETKELLTHYHNFKVRNWKLIRYIKKLIKPIRKNPDGVV